MIRSLWPAICAEDEKALAPYITRSEVRPFSRKAYEDLATPFTEPHFTFPLGSIEDYPNDEIFRYDDYADDASLCDIAYEVTRQIVEAELREATVLSFLPGDPNFYIIVTDLLGAIYWHLARELSGAPQNYRLCQHCQSLIRDARTDAKYCSASCRQKAFQLKKKQEDQS